MCVLLMLYEKFYKCQLDPVDWQYCSVQLCSYLLSAGFVNYWQGIYISNYNSLFGYFPFGSVNFCLIYCNSLLLSIYTFRIVIMENWLFYHYVTPSLSLIIFLALKSALSEINIATPPFFPLVLTWCMFPYPFTFNLFVSLK